MQKSFSTLNDQVLKHDLCTGCGTCIGICPANCLSYVDEKIILSGHCISCGMCNKVCPGREFDFDEYSKEIFHQSYDIRKILGHYLSIFSGYSNNKKVRKNAASGGIITEIADFLLNGKYVDGVVVIGSKSINEYQPFIARTSEEIKQSAQSKYTLIPTNTIIKKILSEDGIFAVVGLPCHIHGLRKAMKYNIILKDKIKYTIGLFCGFNMHMGATDYLIKKSKIKKNEIKDLQYRKKIGNDTGFYVSDGRRKSFIKKHEYTYLNLFYSPKRCQLCYDYSAEFADISVGDAWEKGLGWSRIVIRTEKGQEVIDRMVEAQRITLDASSEEDVLKTQKNIISHKKKDIWYRWKKSKYVPKFNIDGDVLNYKTGIRGKVQYYIMRYGGNKFGRIMLSIVPFKLLRKMSSVLRK